MSAIKKRMAAALLIGCLMLTGCGNKAQVASDEAVIVLPEPEDAGIGPFYGESFKNTSREITLHYVSDDRYALNSVTSAIASESSSELIGSVLTELFSASADALPGTAVSGATLLGYEYSCGSVTVNLGIDSMLYQNEIEAQLFIASIANTLLGLDGIDAVNILVGGQALNICRLPAGVYTAPVENIPAAYAQLESESDHFLNEGSVSLSRSAMLYFPSENGRYLLPEIREIEFGNADYVSGLIDALKAGPISETACVSAIPGNAELFNTAPHEAVTAAGERIIYLDFNSLMLNYLAFAGMEEWELYGSIVLTLTSFLPEIDAVCIMIDGKNLESCVFPDKAIDITGGMVYRSDFAGRIGSAAELYFAAESGALSRRRCALSRTGAHSPRRLLEALMIAQPTEEGLYSVFPEGITPNDILGVMVDGRLANINLSANFYARCQSLDARGERSLVYAMVNTLSELEGIGAVRFFIEGNAVDTLTDHIYLKTALLPDRGMVEE